MTVYECDRGDCNARDDVHRYVIDNGDDLSEVFLCAEHGVHVYEAFQLGQPVAGRKRRRHGSLEPSYLESLIRA